jgi:hypothetical protein
MSGAILVSAASLSSATAVSADISSKEGGEWWVGYFTGIMTDGKAHEALDPFNVEFVDTYLAGLVLGYERRIGNSRFSYGAEFQANAHFGQQGFYEIVVPAVIRYHPKDSWFDAFDSFAFALGPSHYSEISDLERDNYGESRRNLFYWYVETEFKTSDPKSSLFARVHHRSNAWDAVEPNGGSNALVIGFRKKF